MNKQFVRIVVKDKNRELYRLINIRSIDWVEATENSDGSYTYKIYVKTKYGHDIFTISETVYKKLEERYTI
jgi:adenine C2-methylase RlmN of 23S rRNA A2503 and tRNA A37